MSDDLPAGLKPQDTIILLLGELRGQMAAILTSNATQADINSENRREHEEFRTAITEIKAAQPVKVSPWAKIGVVVAIPASLIALVGFITIYLAPN